MAGHSKWANIKFRKAAQDAKRGKVFTKLIKEITVAARIGGSDADANPRLRAAIDKALGANMTRDTIERAVKRGAGELEGADIEEIRYEGYGPGGIAVLVETATDNRNRTVSEVRHAFSKHGGNLGTDGSVAYLFSKIGSIVFSDDQDEEQIMEIALEAGADDIESDDGVIEVVTPPESFHQVERAFKDAGIEPEMSELIQRPSTEAELAGEEAEKIIKLIDALEDLDDVQDVFTNASFVESA
ncbi:MAG: YebC/PmpR family DNA-binding transcriptional regulator [bacterium]